MNRDALITWGMIATAVAMLAVSERLRASEINDNMKSSFTQADISKAGLENQSIEIAIDNGDATSTGSAK